MQSNDIVCFKCDISVQIVITVTVLIILRNNWVTQSTIHLTPPPGENMTILNTADWLLGCSTPPTAPSMKNYGILHVFV